MQALSEGMRKSGAVEICQRLGEISGGKVLDVATSQGSFIGTMMNALKDYDSFIGIDISHDDLEKARSEFVDKPVEFEIMNAEELNFPDDSFDTVCLSYSIHHLKNSKQVVLIKGNHDTILEPIARKKKLSIRDFYCVGKICILHGHKILLNKEIHSAKLLIIAHEHPAIFLQEGPKVEKYKCFLLGKFKKQKLIVMPSFLPIVEGTDLRKEELLSPYLHQPLGNFEVFILGDKVYKLGKLKNIK